MNIVDFHVHAGRFDLLREDIQGLLTRFPFEAHVDVRELFSLPAVLKAYLRQHGVVRAVVLAECGPGTNFSIDSRMIAERFGGDPFFVPFGSINPNHHVDPVAEWERDWKMGIMGYKFYPADHGYDPLMRGMTTVYERCEREGQPIMFHTGLTGQKDTAQQFIRPRDFRSIAERHPGLRIVLAHGGKPHWFDEALAMAEELGNIYVDTGLVAPTEVARWLAEYPLAKGKILFGSDLPVCGGYAELRQRWTDAAIGEADLRLILVDNAMSILDSIPSAHAS